MVQIFNPSPGGLSELLILVGGGETTCSHVYASCARVHARIFTEKKLVVLYNLTYLSFKFHKDRSVRCGDICKTILTLIKPIRREQVVLPPPPTRNRVKGWLPSKVVFCHWSSSVKGRLSSKVVFNQRSSSIKGHLPLKVVFLFWVIFIFGF